MLFPDGTIKEGMFDNNIYMGAATVVNPKDSRSNSKAKPEK